MKCIISSLLMALMSAQCWTELYCELTWQLGGDQCYRAEVGDFTFDMAVDKCSEQGAVLAKMETEIQRKRLVTLLNRTTKRSAWIGIRRDSSGTFRWLVDNTTSTLAVGVHPSRCFLRMTITGGVRPYSCSRRTPKSVALCQQTPQCDISRETCETESIFNETRIEQEQTTPMATLRQTDMTTQNVSTQQATTGNVTVQSTTEGARKRTSLVGDLTSTSLPTTNVVVESIGNEGTTPTVVGRTMINRPHYQEKERKNNTRGKVAAVIEGDQPENSGDVSDDRKSAGLDIPLVVGLGSALTVVVLVGSIAFVILRHVAENARSVSPQRKTGEEQAGLMLETVGTESTSENTRRLQPVH